MKKLVIGVLLTLHLFPLLSAQQLSRTLAQSIARHIWATSGLSGTCPTISFGTNPVLASWSHNIILIDSLKVVVPLQQQLGASAETALAIIIGHEIHHARKNETGGYAAVGPSGERKKIELDGDLYGLMMAYFAGYADALQVFDQIFSALDIPPNSEDYPSIEERRKMDEQLLTDTKNLLRVFEMGNLLLMSAQVDPGNSNKSDENYAYARLCYRHVQSKLPPTPEINFNIGLSYFLEALSLRKADRYLFPLECSDFPALKRLGGTKYAKGDSQLDSANYYFNIVLQQKSTFSETGAFKKWLAKNMLRPQLGIYSVALLKDENAGLNLLDQADKNMLRTPEFQMLRAIGLAMRSQTTQSQADRMASEHLLTELLKEPDPAIRQQAQFNLRVLRKESESQKRNPPCTPPVKNGLQGMNHVVWLMKERVNTGEPLDDKQLYTNTVDSLYLIEKWYDAGLNDSQRAFQNIGLCDCSTDVGINWRSGYGKYRYWSDTSGENNFIFYTDALHPERSTCYRVFRSTAP